MQTILWMNQHPVIVTDPRCHLSFLMLQYKSEVGVLKALERGDDSVLKLAIEVMLETKTFAGLSAHRVFWESRIEPVVMDKKRHDILAKKLALQWHLPEIDTKKVTWSDVCTE